MNLKDFAQKIRSTSNEISTEIAKLTVEEAPVLKRYIDIFTPVKSGNLKRNTKVEGQKDIIAISNDLDYAESVEYGHRTKGGSFVSGQYFIKKGFLTWKADFENRNKNFITTILDRKGK